LLPVDHKMVALVGLHQVVCYLAPVHHGEHKLNKIAGGIALADLL
jgi:hypothetical protein